MHSRDDWSRTRSDGWKSDSWRENNEEGGEENWPHKKRETAKDRSLASRATGSEKKLAAAINSENLETVQKLLEDEEVSEGRSWRDT